MKAGFVADFIRALQFLTRFQLIKEVDWSLEALGRSVRFFPWAGGVIGLVLGGCAWGMVQLFGETLPMHAAAALLILLEIMLTGGLHCDGFMDTMDGIFSGRSRERMLEIMKDSRVGAYGAMSFALLMLVKYSFYLDIPLYALPMASLVMPIAGRWAVVAPLVHYPYARPQGLGQGFGQYAGGLTVWASLLLTLILLAPLGLFAMGAGLAASLIAWAVASYAAGILGGLTGDVYGAIIELSQLGALAVFVFWR